MRLARFYVVLFSVLVLASCGGFDFLNAEKSPADVSNPDPIADVGDLPDDGTTPGDGQTPDPGDGETDPGDGETDPGDGETDPGNGTSEPECNGTALPDFELEDVNPQSASLGDMLSPQQYRGQVSVWYFMHTS